MKCEHILMFLKGGGVYIQVNYWGLLGVRGQSSHSFGDSRTSNFLWHNLSSYSKHRRRDHHSSRSQPLICFLLNLQGLSLEFLVGFTHLKSVELCSCFKTRCLGICKVQYAMYCHQADTISMVLILRWYGKPAGECILSSSQWFSTHPRLFPHASDYWEQEGKKTQLLKWKE